jgi:hypothetical protein
MYNYHTSVVISKYVFRLKKKIFCFQNALGYWWHCNFYSAGVVTHDRRIGSSRDASFSEILSDLAFSFFTLVTCEKQNKLKSGVSILTLCRFLLIKTLDPEPIQLK